MASAHPEDDVNLRERWIKYKKVMEKNAPKAVKLLLDLHVKDLRLHLRTKMEFKIEFEFDFINVESNDPAKKIVDRLWNVLIFRPDVAVEAERVCRRELLQEPFADLLREAIEAAEWSEDMWSPPPQTQVSPADLWRCGDVLAGLATMSFDDLKRCEILTTEGAALVKKKAPFSEARGCELVRQMSPQAWKKLQNFCHEKAKNRFLVRVLDAASHKLWPGPPAIISNSPPLPQCVTERNCFRESQKKLEEAIKCEVQQWFVIHGPPAAGKTVTASYLAQENSYREIWISFGQNSREFVYKSARDIVKKRFPEADPTRFAKLETFLSDTLTAEATKDVILFFDDVRDPNDLVPFAKVKTAVITSRSPIHHHRVKSHLTLELNSTFSEGIEPHDKS